ncbi:MAG TPA: transposase, partial [Candidatus Acidoferrum sp.]
ASQFSSSTPARLDFDLQPSDRENRASQLFLRSQWTYEKTYCQRGDVENRIKELHDGMQIRRTSCSNFLANTFRVLLTAAA